MNTVSKKTELEQRLQQHRRHSDRIVRIAAVNAALHKYWDARERERELEDLRPTRPTLPAPPPWAETTAVVVPGGRRER